MKSQSTTKGEIDVPKKIAIQRRRQMDRKRPPKSEYIGFQIEPEIKEALEQSAWAEDISVGRIIRNALKEYLDRREKKAA
jgi:hypothetical protein